MPGPRPSPGAAPAGAGPACRLAPRRLWQRGRSPRNVDPISFVSCLGEVCGVIRTHPGVADSRAASAGARGARPELPRSAARLSRAARRRPPRGGPRGAGRGCGSLPHHHAGRCAGAAWGCRGRPRSEGVRRRPFPSKGLILAQNERWRRGLGMQVVRGPFGGTRGARVSKATATSPGAGHSRGKPRVIPGAVAGRHRRAIKGAIPPRDGPSWHQVVGGVTAHQAPDAYRACERGPAHWD
jgi:hypothetical protein